MDGLGGGFGYLLVDSSEGEDLALEILKTFPEVVVLGGEVPALDPQGLVVGRGLTEDQLILLHIKLNTYQRN